MPLATTRRAGLVDQVIDQMRGAITSGEWPVGQRIPPEPELVTALGVGRNTVREAVRALSHAGLLEVRQGDGTFVRATSEISGAVRRMCGTELKEVLQVRRTLEVEGARLAAKHRTEAELARLTELLHKRDAAMEDEQWAEVIEHDTAFHVLLVQCSHNALLAELYQGLTEAVKASVAASVDTSQPGNDQVSHTGLLHAVRDGDQEKAAIEAGGFFEELIEKFC
ncbi:FadR/GntR family transcriptional regulator [Lentzea sp.]|uniref:FadR/GntR family transcriptional regulator n=1 Tax=Lentzea sp. TaxID=56099 RepID=UPI002CFBA5DB|nr:FadR/GntR family transcriptional regulator [Lentzea sp.]HUQ58682.1 FadR/GntR family transcriptional regulator [Lentzea sp.]